MKRILLTCGGGMSTSILANNLVKIAKENNQEIEVNAVGFESLDNFFETDHDYELLLVAPQIKHKFNEVSAIASKYNIKSDQIGPTEYAPLGAKKLYERTIKGE